MNSLLKEKITYPTCWIKNAFVCEINENNCIFYSNISQIQTFLSIVIAAKLTLTIISQPYDCNGL